MDLMTSAEKADAAQAMKDIWDTFRRTEPLRFYKLANEIVNVFDPLYSSLQDFTENSNITQTATYSDFYVRIWYEQNQPESNFIEGGGEQGVRAKQLYNRVKIQMELDGFNYLKDAKRFILFDEEYQVQNTWRRIGILGEFVYYEVILQRII